MTQIQERLVAPHEHVPADRPPRGLRILVITTLVVLVAALAACGAAVVDLNGRLGHLQAALERSSGAYRADAAAQQKQLGALDDRLTLLAGTRTTTDVDALNRQVTDLQKQVAGLQAATKGTCILGDVSSQRSHLDGERTADQYTRFQYYADLQGILDAACGALPVDDN